MNNTKYRGYRREREQLSPDMVAVVRCKDCVHDGLLTCPICYIERHELIFVNHDPEFFCAYGERKEVSE